MDRMQAQLSAAQTLASTAEAMGLKGVGATLILKDGEVVWTPTIVVVKSFQRDADPNRGPEDTGSNYAAVALSKMFEMVETSNDSGTTPNRRPKKGEFGYRGGLVLRKGKWRLFVCFSGGTADEDVEASQGALVTLTTAFDQLG